MTLLPVRWSRAELAKNRPMMASTCMVTMNSEAEVLLSNGPNARIKPKEDIAIATGDKKITIPLKRRHVKLPVFSVDNSDAEVSRLRCVFGISNNADNATTINSQPAERKPTSGI